MKISIELFPIEFFCDGWYLSWLIHLMFVVACLQPKSKPAGKPAGKAAGKPAGKAAGKPAGKGAGKPSPKKVSVPCKDVSTVCIAFNELECLQILHCPFCPSFSNVRALESGHEIWTTTVSHANIECFCQTVVHRTIHSGPMCMHTQCILTY